MISEKINKLIEQEKALKAKIQLLKNREATKIRKYETRVKILLGAYLIEQFKNSNFEKNLLDEMNKFLTRDKDKNIVNEFLNKLTIDTQ